MGCASVLILLILYLGQAGRHDEANGSSSSSNNNRMSSSSNNEGQHVQQHVPKGSNITLKPERITLNGRQVLYQFPPNSQASCTAETTTLDSRTIPDRLRGALFLYHGCTRTAMSFFYSPQGRDMMRTALSAGLAVVAYEKAGSCWSSSADLDVSLEAGREWIERYLVPHCGNDIAGKVPIYGFGASSGGSFVAEVAEATRQQRPGTKDGFAFAAINVQIMTPRVAVQTPTVFTVMSRDEFTLQGVEQMVSDLETGNVPTLVLKTQPTPVTVEYLLERFRDDEHFSKEIAKGIIDDLKEMKAIADDGTLMKNPRSIDLNPLFARYPKPSGGAFGVSIELWDMMTPAEREDASQLWLVEELNVAYDQHEITHEKFGDAIEFFSSQSKGGGVVK